MRIAVLDLYEGQPNQGMRCIRDIISGWGRFHQVEINWQEFDVRANNQVPDLSFDVFISSGGPGSPEASGSEWEVNYFNWLQQIENWNNDPFRTGKKYVFLICHSFQLACRYYNLGIISKRRSPAFGVFPVHVTAEGQADEIFRGLGDPFYVVDSRDWQVTDPQIENIKMMGAQILCIEKYRPHVPYQQAIMGLRFNPWMAGTQFHPEADAFGMSMYLQTEEKKKIVVDTYGEEKWKSMIAQLNDPDKIMATYSLILPNFLTSAYRHLQASLVI